MKQHLFDICQQLIQDGKKPSVALLRTKAPKSTHLADIIAIIQSYQADPNFFSENAGQKLANPTSDESCTELTNRQLTERIIALEQHISKIEEKLRKL